MGHTEHDRPWAVVGVQESDLDVVTRLELETCRCVQRQWFLVGFSPGRTREASMIAQVPILCADA